MKVAVVGCGAMGSVYAALLAAGGHDVWAVDTWQEHVDAIRARGLRVEGASGERTVRISATTAAVDVGPCDLVILATKVMHVEAAAQAAKPLLHRKTLVLSIQNGIGGPDVAASVLGKERLVVGVASGFGASVREPGHVHHNGWELLRFGELDGPVSPRLNAMAALWRESGFRVKCFDNIDQLVWEKLICNVAYSGPCALTERTIGEVMEDPDIWPVAAECATEAYRVARARGTQIDFEDPAAHVRSFGARIAHARPSMLLDHLAGRLSEVDALNGAIPLAAQAVGLMAPINETVSALVRARERRLGLRQ